MKDFNLVLKYEKALSKLFTELKLSAALCRFVRALIVASKGRTTFEISQRELGKAYLADASRNEKSKAQNVADNLRALKKWQEAHRLTLVEIHQGRRTRDLNGKFVYVKTKYEFALLDNFVKAIYSESEHELDARISQAIQELKDSFKPTKTKKAYHPRHLVKKARKTIYAKLKVIFTLAQGIENLNPVDYCQGVLNESKSLLDGLEDEYVQKLNRKKRLDRFTKKLSCADSEVCN